MYNFFFSYVTLDLDSNHEPSETHGLEGVRYIGSMRSLDNGTLFPDQKCFAPNISKNSVTPNNSITTNKTANYKELDSDNYLPRGLRDVSKCRFNAPAYLSFPHFYLADENLMKPFVGLKPDPKKHQLSIELEPKTGLPLQILARVQINIKTQPISLLRMFSKAKVRYWPMVWFTQRAVLTDDLASQVRSLLVLEHLGPYTGWGIVGVGLLFSAVGVFILVTLWHKNQSETRPLVTS